MFLRGGGFCRLPFPKKGCGDTLVAPCLHRGGFPQSGAMAHSRVSPALRTPISPELWYTPAWGCTDGHMVAALPPVVCLSPVLCSSSDPVG